MTLEREEAQATFGQPRPYARPDHHHDQYAKRPHGSYGDDDDDRRRHGQSGHHKKKRFDLFDIFD
jgi:Zn-finger nucleic acid-binding protein